MSPKLSCKEMSFSFGESPILTDIECSFDAGEFIGLIGPNGAGKTTLLRLLMGILKPSSGKVLLGGRPLNALSRREIARQVSMVAQDIDVSCPFSVREIVAMGRNPHLGRFQPEGEKDVQAIQEALRHTEVLSMQHRPVDELSGGERQRVLIARALAQETPVLLLDEPTANLDMCHQLDVLALVRTLANNGHLAIASLHDLSMASRFCDRLLLVSNGSIVADGPPSQVLTEANLINYFLVEARIAPGVHGGGVAVTPLVSCSSNLRAR